MNAEAYGDFKCIVRNIFLFFFFRQTDIAIYRAAIAAKNGNKHIRKSERIRKQRYEIHPDDIGNNDDEKDKSYKR